MTRSAGSLHEVGICGRRTTTAVAPKPIRVIGVRRGGGLEPSEIILTGDVNTQLAEVVGNKAEATVVSNGTARQFLFKANLTHTNAE